VAQYAQLATGYWPVAVTRRSVAAGELTVHVAELLMAAGELLAAELLMAAWELMAAQ